MIPYHGVRGDNLVIAISYNNTGFAFGLQWLGQFGEKLYTFKFSNTRDYLRLLIA